MQPIWLSVKVHPRAGKEILLNLGPGRFEAWVKGQPIGGHANDAVIGLLARMLQIPRERLHLVKGRSGRHKLFKVVG